jgi:hypothetical protein
MAAQVDLCVALGRFLNIELFERGIYAVRVRVKPSSGVNVSFLLCCKLQIAIASFVSPLRSPPLSPRCDRLLCLPACRAPNTVRCFSRN